MPQHEKEEEEKVQVEKHDFSLQFVFQRVKCEHCGGTMWGSVSLFIFFLSFLSFLSFFSFFLSFLSFFQKLMGEKFFSLNCNFPFLCSECGIEWQNVQNVAKFIIHNANHMLLLLVLVSKSEFQENK